jgi:hypothetical protein
MNGNSEDSNVELWHVEVSPNEVKIVTLEQLDEAFQNDWVGVETRVWQEGMPCAMRLGDLLGVDESSPAADAEHHSIAPPAGAEDDLVAPAVVAPYPVAPPPVAAEHHSVPAPARAPSFERPVRATTPEAPMSWPPVVTAAPASVPPPSMPASIAPLAFDVGPDVAFPRPSRAPKVIVGGGVLAVAAALAAFAVNAIQATSTPDVAAASMSPVATPPPAPPAPVSHRYDPGDEPVHLGPEKPLTITQREPTADDKRVAAALAGKAAAAKVRPAPRAPSRIARTGKRHGSGPSFKSAGKGSQYDPLNGSL